MRRGRALLKEILRIIQGHFWQQKSLNFKDWQITTRIFNSRCWLLTIPLMSSLTMGTIGLYLSAHVRELILTLDRLVQNLD